MERERRDRGGRRSRLGDFGEFDFDLPVGRRGPSRGGGRPTYPGAAPDRQGPRGAEGRPERAPGNGDGREAEPGEGVAAQGPWLRSETAKRVLVAVPLVVLALTLIVAGGAIFALGMVAFALLAQSELYSMTARARPFAAAGFAVAVGLIAAAYLGGQYEMVLVVLATLPLMFGLALGRRSLEGVTAAFAVTVLGVVWVALPFAHAVLLRELPDHGAALLVDVLVATFVADTAAYAGGKLFGRRLLVPRISPHKTVEGLAFGFVGGIMGFWFAGLYQNWLPGIDALLMGACVAAIAPVGDLFQSLVKRDLGVKDSGRTFGPHGGVLDRLDAVLFTVVAGYYLSVAFVY